MFPPLMKILSHKDAAYDRFVRKLQRRAIPETELRSTVAKIIEKVGKGGDKALIELTKRFDGAKLTPNSLWVSEKEFAAAEKAVKSSTRKRGKTRGLPQISRYPRIFRQ